MLPANADPDPQARSLVEEGEPRLGQARAGQRAVFFVDAAPFGLAPFLGFLWSVPRIFWRAPAGRHRFTVWGALTALTHERVTVSTETSMTATEGWALLPQRAALTRGVSWTGVLANARSHRGAQVGTLAASFQLDLCFLPPYSPTLTLIARLGKFVKKQGLSSTSYADCAAFKTALVQCLAQTHTTHRTALDSLLTLRFQLFAKAQFVPA
jgi:DDE superfamily endonuclease